MRKSYLAAGMLLALSGLVLVSGCSKKIEGNEKTHPVYIKAKNDRDTGRYLDAANGFNDLLNRAPKSAFLHKELATLYGDNLDEYYKAIYHYQRYLELEKLSSEDQRQIRGYISAYKRRAAEMMIQEDPTLAAGQGNVAAAADPETSDKLLRLGLMEQNMRALVAKHKEYQVQIEALKKENAELKGKSAAPASAARSAASAPVAATGEFDAYVVQPGDTLSRIAKKNYGSKAEKYVKLIRDANSLTSDSVKVGQKLKIPKLPH